MIRRWRSCSLKRWRSNRKAMKCLMRWITKSNPMFLPFGGCRKSGVSHLNKPKGECKMVVQVGILGFAHGHVSAYCEEWKNLDYGVSVAAGWDHDANRLEKAVG